YVRASNPHGVLVGTRCRRRAPPLYPGALLPLPAPPPSSTLFPYTTLFRSDMLNADVLEKLKAQADALKAEEERRRSEAAKEAEEDRKSTRLNSSHVKISYAVFCLKKKTKHPKRAVRSISDRLTQARSIIVM